MNRGSRPLSGVIMSLSHIYSATSSHPTTHWLHQYLYSATYIMVGYPPKKIFPQIFKRPEDQYLYLATYIHKYYNLSRQTCPWFSKVQKIIIIMIIIDKSIIISIIIIYVGYNYFFSPIRCTLALFSALIWFEQNGLKLIQIDKLTQTHHLGCSAFEWQHLGSSASE